MKKHMLIISIGILVVFMFVYFNNKRGPKGEKMKNGSFYSLETLYKKKEITDNDLINIAYRNNYGELYNEYGEEQFVIPESIKPVEEIDSKTLNNIISDYFDFLLLDDYFSTENIEVDNISISVNAGIYNGYYALRFKDNKIINAVSGESYLGGLKFIYPYKGGNEIILWKPN